jgi:hypothetical protein
VIARGARERENVLPEVVGEFHDGARRAGRHHACDAIAVSTSRPSSADRPSALYICAKVRGTFVHCPRSEIRATLPNMKRRQRIDTMLDAHAWMRQRGARMTEMYTYESWSIDTGDYVPSGRYGTREAILERMALT